MRLLFPNFFKARDRHDPFLPNLAMARLRIVIAKLGNQGLKQSLNLRSCICVLAVMMFAGCDLFESKPAEVKIDSEPTGAFLTVNGKEVGRTPYIMKQPAYGKYLAHFTKEGYQDEDRVLDINPETAPEIVTKMNRQSSYVLFESNPTGGDVSVDGIFKGKTPLLATDLAFGDHKVSFKLEGYEARDTALKIEDATPKLCQMNMRSNYVVLQVDSKPSGASVMIDGIHKGKTPCIIDDVLIGNHAIKLVLDGYKTYQDELKLTQTGRFPVSIQMEEQLAVLEVTSAPPDARVTVDGEYKGRTPMQVTGLRDGPHTVVIEKVAYDKIERSIEIKNRQDAKVDVTLDKMTGTLALDVKPIGANILVDGELKGNGAADPVNIELMPGNYSIDVNNKGYRSQTFKMEVTARKIVNRSVNLTKLWAKDTIVILVDGRSKDGMLIKKNPNGSIKLETEPGIFEEFGPDQIKSINPITSSP
jgi:hypothetical protein